MCSLSVHLSCTCLCASELVPQKGNSSGWCFNVHVSSVVGTIIVACCASSVSRSDGVLHTWSPVVVGDAQVSQSQRKSSGKSQASFLFSPSLTKPSKAIS